MPIAKSASARIDGHFATPPGPRRRKVGYPLISSNVIAISGVTCGADDFMAIADFGRKKRRWFRKILDFRFGNTVARPVQCDLLDDVSGRLRAVLADLCPGAPRSDPWPRDRDRRQNKSG